MPLSDEERRRLEELERELIEDDPELAQKLESEPANRSAGRTAVLGILALVAGLVLVVVGIAAKIIVIGVVGFLLMGAGAYRFMSNGPDGSARG